MIKPVVLIEVDRFSRLSFLQSDGVHVGFVDRRVDPALILFPEQNQIEAILSRLVGLPTMSPGADDPIGSAVATIRRVRAGLVLITDGPVPLTKFGEPA